MNSSMYYRRNRSCPCPRCRMRGLMGPAMLITIGVLFLLQELGVLSFGNSWPVILLVAGGVLLARNNASTEGHIPRYLNYGGYPFAPPIPPTPPAPPTPPVPDYSQSSTTGMQNQDPNQEGR